MKLLPLAALLAFATPAARAQTVGSQPGQLFDLGVDARALAMGGAFTGVGGEAGALYYNPAGLGLMPGREGEAMHAALYGGASFDSLVYAQNLPKALGGWGAEVLRLGVGGIQGSDAAGNPTGSFGYSELGAGAGFGLTDVAIDGLSLGSSVKADDRSLLGVSNRLIGADFGALYGPFFGGKMSVGLVFQNAVAVSQGGTSDRFPAAARLGAAYSPLDPLLLVLDVSNAGDFRAGVEYRCGSMFALRAGWTSGGPTFGGGVQIKDSLSFDAAVLDDSVLGVSERISAGYRFGAYRTKYQSSLALEDLINARHALERRDYVEAGRLLDAAIEADPAVGRRLRIDGGDWKLKIARFRRLLDGLRPDEGDQDVLRAPTVEAQLAQASIQALMDEDLDDAMLLAQVAAGEGPRGSAFSRLPRAMARATGRAQIEGATLPVAAFVEDRLRRTGDALYARRFAEAVEYARQNTLVEPDNALAWERLGAAELKAGRREDASSSYRKSLELDPSNGTLKSFLQENFPK